MYEASRMHALYYKFNAFMSRTSLRLRGFGQGVYGIKGDLLAMRMGQGAAFCLPFNS